MKGIFIQLIALGKLRHFRSVDLKYTKFYIIFYNDQTIKICCLQVKNKLKFHSA